MEDVDGATDGELGDVNVRDDVNVDVDADDEKCGSGVEVAIDVVV